MQKNYFISQESSRYSVRKQDLVFLLFVYIQTFQKKLVFYMNENYDDCHHLKTTRTFIYTKIKNLRNAFIYKKQYTFQKARQFSLRLYVQKSNTLDVTGFS